MNSIRFFLLRVTQESPPTPGEWGAILTLLTVLGTIINILYSNRNSIVQQQREMIESLNQNLANLEDDYQSLRNDFANSERRRIELEGDVKVLKDKLQYERLKVKSLKKRLSKKQKAVLRGKKN